MAERRKQFSILVLHRKGIERTRQKWLGTRGYTNRQRYYLFVLLQAISATTKMTILLPTLAVAFAAFCVWLTVRIVNRPERWAKRLAWGLWISMVPSYVIFLGPLLWLNRRGMLPDSVSDACQRIYWPLEWLCMYGPAPISAALDWYRQIWI